MATARTCLTMAILMVAGMLICSSNLAWGQCGGSVPDIIAQCDQFVQKTGPIVKPSPQCCAEVTRFNIPCVCNTLVRPDIGNFISLEKAGFVARFCGLNIPPQFKCGPVTVP